MTIAACLDASVRRIEYEKLECISRVGHELALVGDHLASQDALHGAGERLAHLLLKAKAHLLDQSEVSCADKGFLDARQPTFEDAQDDVVADVGLASVGPFPSRSAFSRTISREIAASCSPEMSAKSLTGLFEPNAAAIELGGRVGLAER